MANLSPAQRKQLRPLRIAFASRLPERIHALRDTAEAALALLEAGAPESRGQAVEELCHLTHQLAWSSSTFGFATVAEAAGRLEACVTSIRESDSAGTDDRTEIIKLLDGLERVSGRVGRGRSAAKRRGADARAETPVAAERRRIPGRRQRDQLADDSPPWTVLLVDDDEDILVLEAFLLGGTNVKVETARSGNEALGRILAQPPDLIIADVKMEGMSGYELCRLVRAMGELDIPFIFLSALGSPPERIMGLRMGADDYLVKPIDGEELLLKVRRQLQKSRRLRAPLSPAMGNPRRETAPGLQEGE